MDGQTVYFTDGSHEEVDALLFGTGFDPSLPFLIDEVRRTLDVDADHIDLHAFTFHPDLLGLTRALLFGPLTPSSFRLSGPDRPPDAQLTPEQQMQFQVLAGARLSQLADRLMGAPMAPDERALPNGMIAVA